MRTQIRLTDPQFWRWTWQQNMKWTIHALLIAGILTCAFLLLTSWSLGYRFVQSQEHGLSPGSNTLRRAADLAFYCFCIAVLTTALIANWSLFSTRKTTTWWLYLIGVAAVVSVSSILLAFAFLAVGEGRMAKPVIHMLTVVIEGAASLLDG